MLDLDLAFDDRGAGEAVVLLPPFPFDRRFWRQTSAAIADAGFRAIAVDYPGFGPEGPAAPAALSIASIADRTAGLLHQLGVERAAVLGMSMGGYVALAFAARFRERLRAVILADTRATADTAAALGGRAQALETLASRGVEAYLDGSLPRLLAPDAPPATVAAARALAVTRAEALVAGIGALRDRPDRTTDAEALACPALVVCGAVDQVVPPAEMRALAAVIPGARFVEVPGAGHLSSLEAPALFNGAVLAFLSSLTQPREGAGDAAAPAPPAHQTEPV